MPRKRQLLFVLLVILSIFLVACGSNADSDTEVGTETDTSETVSTEDDSEDTSSDVVTLTQNIIFEDELGSASINYPETWVANVDNRVFNMATSEDIVATIPSTLESEQVIVTIIVIPTEITTAWVDEGQEVNPANIATTFSVNFIGESFGDSEDITIGDQAASIAIGTIENLDVVLISIDVGNGAFAVVYAVTASGEGDSICPTIEAIAASVSYTTASGE